MSKRLKHQFAAMICNREGGKSKLKECDAVQAIDIMTSMMAEDYMKAGTDYVKTDVADFLEMDARKKYQKMKKKAYSRKK